MARERSNKTSWIPVVGRWDLGTPDALRYLGPSTDPFPHGIALSNHILRDGHVSVSVSVSAWDQDSAARLVLGYEPRSAEYISVGLGGYGKAFVISRFVSGVGWRAEAVTGDWNNLQGNRTYKLDVKLRGQNVSLQVDDIRVLDCLLMEPPDGSQVGLYTWGVNPTSFSGFAAEASRPTGFVIMQFTDEYQALYFDVLKQVANELMVDLRRADETKGPGLILQDIVKDISDATVVVAEITPTNKNVFYELGYAHALRKPTILLARKGEALPFDVSGYRVIFYDDSIAGKSRVENEFREHLTAVLDSP